MLKHTMKAWKVSVAGLSLLFCVGCVGTQSRVQNDDEPESLEVSDVDIRAMAREMATAIIEVPMIANATNPVSLAFLSIENKTGNKDFDSYNLLSKIRQNLLANSQGKVSFLDKEALNAILAERDAKRGGQVTTRGQEDLTGVDFFLTGHASSVRGSGSGATVVVSHRFAFRLTNAETSQVVWEKDYEFKKVVPFGGAVRRLFMKPFTR